MALEQILGIDVEKLTVLMNSGATEATLNEYGRFDDLKGSIDKQKAKVYLEKIAGESLSPPKINMRAATLLRRFILEEDFTLPGAGSNCLDQNSV